jgi:hypothetical protein
LVDFFSEDSIKTNTKSSSIGKPAHNIEKITDEIQNDLWAQPPSSTDKFIAGKLSLCIGLPVMI